MMVNDAAGGPKKKDYARRHVLLVSVAEALEPPQMTQVTTASSSP
jgi:hypothetical protein